MASSSGIGLRNSSSRTALRSSTSGAALRSSSSGTTLRRRQARLRGPSPKPISKPLQSHSNAPADGDKGKKYTATEIRDMAMSGDLQAPDNASEILTKVTSTIDGLFETENELRERINDRANRADTIIDDYDLWHQKVTLIGSDPGAGRSEILKLLAQSQVRDEQWAFLDNKTAVHSPNEFSNFLSIGRDAPPPPTRTSAEEEDDGESYPLVPEQGLSDVADAQSGTVVFGAGGEEAGQLKKMLQQIEYQFRCGFITVTEKMAKQLAAAQERLRPDKRWHTAGRVNTVHLRERLRAYEVKSSLALQVLRTLEPEIQECELALETRAKQLADLEASHSKTLQQLTTANQRLQEDRKNLLLAGVSRSPLSVADAPHPEDQNPPQGERLGVAYICIWGSQDAGQGIWGLQPEDMHAALYSYNHVARTLLAKHGGYEALSAGDATGAVFASPAAALEWAQEMQHALMVAPWPDALLERGGMGPRYNAGTSSIVWRGPRVAVGVHEGHVGLELSEERTQYHGYPLCVARGLADLASPGQVLVSGEAVGAIETALGGHENAIKSLVGKTVEPLGQRLVHTVGQSLDVSQVLFESLEERAQTFNNPYLMPLNEEGVMGMQLEGQFLRHGPRSSTRALDFPRWVEAKQDYWRRQTEWPKAIQKALDEQREAQEDDADVDPPPVGPLATVVLLDVQGLGDLWGEDPALVRHVLLQYHATVRRVCARFRGWEVRNAADFFVLVFASPLQALLFALMAQELLAAAPWPEHLHGCTPAFAQAAACGGPAGPRYLWNGPRVRVSLGKAEGDRDLLVDPQSLVPEYHGPLLERAPALHRLTVGGEVCRALCPWSCLC